MADEVNIPLYSLSQMAYYAATSLFTYLTVGTGSAAITLSTTDLQAAVQIDVSDRNILADTTTVTDNFYLKKFRLTGSMPNSLPVDIQEFGTQTTATSTSTLTFGFTYPVALTKDNNSQWDIFIPGKVIELEVYDQ